jgi:type II secretory pathway pseudopilin PulG
MGPSPAQSSARRGWAAFSIMEILVAVAIIGVLFFTLYSGITFGFVTIQLARENLRATQILQERMETIRLYNWDQVNSNDFMPTTFTATFFVTNQFITNAGLTYTGTVVVSPAPLSEGYSNDLRQVTVELKWLSSNKPRTRSMTTLVSRYGLQNYVY